MVALSAAALACLLPVSTAQASPGDPGNPAPATEVFVEDFENLPAGSLPTVGVLDSGTHQMLDDYVRASPPPTAYTADPIWLSLAQCNGIIASRLTAHPAAAGCSAAQWVHMTSYAGGIAVLNGASTDAATLNHGVSAYTLSTNPGVDSLQFRTTTPIPLPGPGRFITFSVDATTNTCPTAPLYKFYLEDAGTEIPTFNVPINPCTDPRAQTVSAAGHAWLPIDLTGGRFPSDSAVLFPDDELGIVLRQGRNVSSGNDAGFDNIRVLDATPQLDKEFVVPELPAGETAQYRLTVTNRDDLAEKDGWSFSDTLPAGLEVSGTATVTCSDDQGAATATTFPVTASGSTITVAPGDGLLSAGDASCVIEVGVIQSTPGAATYTTGTDEVDDVVGLDLPGDAIVAFTVLDPGSPPPPPPPPPPPAPLPPPPPPPPAPKRAAAQLALECANASLVLIDVRRVGDRVRFQGATSRANVGRLVPIRLMDDRRIVARATVRPDGSFEAFGPLPALRIRTTNRARYRAELDGDRSLALKLVRRLDLTGLDTRAGRITVFGRVIAPFAVPIAEIVVRERTECGGPGKVVARVTPDGRGRFRASFARPRGIDSAIYRLQTRVRKHDKPRTRPKTYPTYTLVRGVDLF